MCWALVLSGCAEKDMNHQVNETIRELVKRSGLRHIAFIMDGNGRWANARMLPREAGHKVGADTFKKIVRYYCSIGIEHCTVYAFSTENWNRPKAEVDAIMRLLDKFAKEAEEEKEIEFHFIGDKKPLAPDMRAHLEKLEADTVGRPYVLNIALNYGGRAEMVAAVNVLLAEGKTEVTEADISAKMYTAHSPDPDLVVRTGKELRTSNFLLWQSAYAEYYFSEKMWPDMTKDDIDEIVRSFAGRKRRFGGLDKA